MTNNIKISCTLIFLLFNSWVWSQKSGSIPSKKSDEKSNLQINSRPHTVNSTVRPVMSDVEKKDRTSGTDSIFSKAGIKINRRRTFYNQNVIEDVNTIFQDTVMESDESIFKISKSKVSPSKE